jgi:rare lipoprotein A
MNTRKYLAAYLFLLLGLGACSTSRGPVSTGGSAGLSPLEAYRLGKLKNAPYVIRNKVYVPMSFDQVYSYEEIGIASWYGQETLDQHNGQPTAYGERFDPDMPSAAHKYLPLPMLVRVTNLDTNKSIVVRVNDRGPFVDDRIIDLSAEAARRLGFFEKGTARVKIESVYH